MSVYPDTSQLKRGSGQLLLWCVVITSPGSRLSSDSWSCTVSVCLCIRLFGSFLHVNELGNNPRWVFLAGVGSGQTAQCFSYFFGSLSILACMCGVFFFFFFSWACMCVCVWVCVCAVRPIQKKIIKNGILDFVDWTRLMKAPCLPLPKIIVSVSYCWRRLLPSGH